MLETIPEKHVIRRNGKAAYYLANKAYGLTRADFPENGVLYNHNGWFVGDDTAADPSYPFETVKIGTQTWMARNIDVDIAGSSVYNNDDSYEPIYGRLYTYMQAKEAEAMFPGWHIPTVAEWQTLIDNASPNSAIKLKAASGWNNGNGTDDFGFAALPAGNKYSSFYSYAGEQALFWSSNDFNIMLISNGSEAETVYLGSSYSVSLRLIKDS
jgi:uncharacterized protein (TIGR02145 family)